MTRLPALVVLAFLAIVSSAGAATYQVQSTSDDDAWLQLHGLTPTATVEVSDEPIDYKLPDRCWHARVFAGLKGYNGKYDVWAWEKGIVCSLNGRIDEYHLRHGKGSVGSWGDGPYPSIAWWKWAKGDHREVHGHYQTDWVMGYANWGVFLDLWQYFSKRVDRKVRWHHYPAP